MCNRDCFNCIYDDCIEDKMDIDEYREIQKRDMALARQQQKENPHSRKTTKAKTRSESSREYYLNHQEEVKAKTREYSNSHKEETKAYYRAYIKRPEVKAKRAAYNREWRRKKREREMIENGGKDTNTERCDAV